MFEGENSNNKNVETLAQDLYGLESAMTEPFVEKVLNMGRVYNKIFEETTPSDKERNAVIEELDGEWGPINQMQVEYTGMVMVRFPGDEEDLRTIFLDGVPVISDGFCVKDEPLYIGDEFLGNVARVQHHLLIPAKSINVEIDTGGDENEIALLGATGDIDNSIIELAVASSERALAWVTASCPELIEDIDNRILNGSGNEDEALISLKGLNLSEYADLSDSFTRNCLSTYLNSVLQIDKAVPYAAQLQGYVRTPEEDSELFIIKSNKALIYIGNILIVPAFTEDEAHQNDWSLGIQIAILPPDRNSDVSSYVASIDSLQDLKSLRGSFYQ